MCLFQFIDLSAFSLFLKTGLVTGIQTCRRVSKSFKIPSEGGRGPKALSRFEPVTSNCQAIIQGVQVTLNLP